MKTIQIQLPDELAQEAERAGVLAPDILERWVREQLKSQRLDKLFAAMDRMKAQAEVPSMSPEEVAKEIAIMRAERRMRHAD